MVPQEKHEENHQPKLHNGLVIKYNTNQRYATTDVTSLLFREVAKRAGVPVQDFCVRNDMGCGSTIGPILASGIGIRCIDVGVPQLSMHRCGWAEAHSEIGWRWLVVDLMLSACGRAILTCPSMTTLNPTTLNPEKVPEP